MSNRNPQSMADVLGLVREQEKTAAAAYADAEPQPRSIDEMDEQEKLAYEKAAEYDEAGRALGRSIYEDMRANMVAEKTASTKDAVLARMNEDPAYTRGLLAKYAHLIGRR